jgi:hypothetical protein
MRKLRRREVIASVALLVALATVGYAASVHLKPPNRNPTFVDKGLTLQVVGSLAGLGEGDVSITLSATADVTATCTNPGSGGTQPAGQNPSPITVTGAEAFPEDRIENGNLSFTVETIAPLSPISGAPGCPNANWIEAIANLSFTSATITVEQPAGTTVYTASCKFSPATSNGPVPANTVTCQL